MNRISLALAMVFIVLNSFSQNLTEVQTFRGSDTPNGSGNPDQFGREIEISGNTAIVSATGHNAGAGAVYVFELGVTNQWVQVAKLTSSDQAAGKGFGNSIAINDDVIVVANSGYDYANQGAYIYEKPLSGWTDMTETIKLNTPASPTAANQSGFGTSVDINGPEILVGAPREDVGSTISAGRIYVFEKSGSSWTTAFLRAELTTTNVGASDYLGQSAQFGDDIIVSGAFTGSSAGTLHVFERPASGTWANATVEDIILFGSDRSNNDGFGGLVSIADDVITTIGAADVSSSSEMNVYAFRKESALWSSQATQNEQHLISLPPYLPFSGFTNVYYTTGMAIQSDIIVIGNGASTGPTMGNNSPVGSVLIAKLSSGNTIHEIDGISYSSNGNLGASVAINGSKFLIGSQLETIGGVVRYFDLSYNENKSQTICPGETFVFGSQTITSAGTYQELFTSVNGLDSLVNLTMNSPLSPTATNASTTYGAQNTAGLVIEPDPLDQISTHFLVTNISGGTLYLNDGSTQVSNGDYINLSDGLAGLKFNPSDAQPGGFEVAGSVGLDGSCVSSSVASVTINVSKPTLTVEVKNKSITYGDALPTFDGSFSGVVNGDDITVSYGSAADGNSSGSFDIIATIADPNSRLSNYDVTNTKGTLTIAQANLSVIVNDKSITYGEALPTYDGSFSGVVNSDDITVSYGSVADGNSAGSFDITATLADPNNRLSNYSIINTMGKLTIAKAQLTATAADITISENDAIPTLDVTYSGFVNGEDAAVLDTEPTVATTGVSGTPGTYPITVSGGADTNYEFSYVNGTLVIENVLGLANAELIVYPNPATNTIRVEGEEIESIIVLGVDGKVLKHSHGFSSVDVSDLKSGTYLLKVSRTNGKRTSHRFIKQ